MKQLLVGAALALVFVCASEAADRTPNPTEAQAPKATAKAGLTPGRRITMMFNPYMQVAQVRKLPPELSLDFANGSTYVPTGTTVEVLADVKFIDAAEIGSLELYVDGAATSLCTGFTNYRATCAFPAAQAGSHTIRLRLLDTDGELTSTPALSFQTGVSVVKGTFEGYQGADPVRYITGWACSTGFAQPLAIQIAYTDPVTLETGVLPTGAAEVLGSESSINQQCLSTGTTFRFRLRVDPAWYPEYSNKALSIRAYSASNPSTYSMLPGNKKLNYVPDSEFRLIENAPALAHGSHYVTGEILNLSAELSDWAGTGDIDPTVITKAEFFDHIAPVPGCTQHFSAPNLKQIQSVSCQVTLTEGEHIYSIRGTDYRNAPGPRRNFASVVQVLSPLPVLSQGAITDAAAFKVRLTGSNFLKTVRVDAFNAVTGAALAGSYQLATPNATTVDVTLQAAHQSIFTQDGVKFRIVNVVGSSPWPSAAMVTLGGSRPRLTRPGAGAIRAGEALLLEADTNNAANVSRVEFLLNGQPLGESTLAPHVLAWNEVPEGTHVLRVRVVRSVGVPLESETVTIQSTRDLAVAACPVPALKEGSWQKLFDFLFEREWRSGVTDAVHAPGWDDVPQQELISH